MVRELLEGGHEVAGLVRSKEAAQRLEASGTRAVRGSVENTDLLRREAAEADAVIHTAFYHKFSHASLKMKLKIMLGGSPARTPARFMEAAVETELRAIEAFGASLSGRSGGLVIAMPTMTLLPAGWRPRMTGEMPPPSEEDVWRRRTHCSRWPGQASVRRWCVCRQSSMARATGAACCRA